MRNFLLGMFVVACILGSWASAGAVVLGFDDISTDFGYGEIPLVYQGFSWLAPTASDYWGVVDNSQYRLDYGNSFDFPSNPNATFNGYSYTSDAGPALSISRLDPFDFIGANFGTFTAGGSSTSSPGSVYMGATSLTLTGKLGGTVVGQSTFNLAAGPLAWYEVNLLGIDTLTVDAAKSDYGNYWLMDNFTYETAGAAPVPEPGTLLLLGSGLAGLAGFRARKFAKKYSQARSDTRRAA